MKTIRVIILISLFLIGSNEIEAQLTFPPGDVCEYESVILNQDGECSYGTWVLAFEDNFDGNKIDESIWMTHYPWGNTLLGNGCGAGSEQQLYIPENVIIDNGMLKLQSNNITVAGLAVGYEDSTTEMSDCLENFRFWDYTSGMIFSKEQFGYGKYEIRCKIPYGRGFWPAFWLFANGAAPWNELDIFEFFTQVTIGGNYKPISVEQPKFGSLYSYYTQDQNIAQGCGPYWTNGTDYSDSFHTFSMIWDNYKIQWLVDDVVRYTKYKYYTINTQVLDCNSVPGFQTILLNTTFPQVEYNNVILNTAIHKAQDLEPDANTTFPSYFEIDYFRYWKKVTCQEELELTDASSVILNSHELYVFTGNSITIGDDFTINQPERLKLIAENEIVMTPGFEAKNGSFYHAKIDPDACPNSDKSGEFIIDNTDLSEGNASNYKNQSQEIASAESSQINEVQFKLFPSPTQDILNVILVDGDITEYEIILSDGQGVNLNVNLNVNSNQAQVDMSKLPQGIYFLRLINIKTSENSLYKIIKR